VNSRRDVLILVAILVGVVLLTLLAGGGSGAGPGGSDRRASTYLATPHGTRALRDVLVELKIPSDRRLQAYVDADSLAGPLVLLAPSANPSPGELHGLAAWVRGGGTLLYAAGMGEDEVGDSLGIATTYIAGGVAGEGAVATAEPGPLTEGVTTVDGFRFGFESGTPGMRNAKVLASSGGYPVVIDYRLGRGRVIAWADALPLTNTRLKSSHAAELFARTAVDAAGGRTLWFDEYHHGFKSGGSVVRGTARFLASERAGHAALQVMAAILGVLLLVGRRFGRPLPSPPARRRSPLEHVEALAGAYRQAGARDTARRLLLAGMARRLGRRTPHTPAAEAELLRRLSSHPTAGEAARVLEAEWRKGRSADLVALSRDVDRYLDEVSRT